MQEEYYLSGKLYFIDFQIFNYFIRGLRRDNKNINFQEMSFVFNHKDTESEYKEISSEKLVARVAEACMTKSLTKDSKLVGYSESTGFKIITVFGNKLRFFEGLEKLKEYFGNFRFFNIFKDEKEFEELYEEYIFGDTKLGEMREIVEQDLIDIKKGKKLW